MSHRLALFSLPLVWALAARPVPREDNPLPAYPERARVALITGDVWFRAWVTEEGGVQGVQITRVPAPDMGFEAAVVPVVKKWRFVPARRGSSPIGAWFEGNVRFSLKPEAEQGIYALGERASLAWNRSDAQVLASLFSDTAHIHTVTQDPAHGPRQIRERFEKLWAATLKGASIRLGVDMIRFFGENRAEIHCTYELAGRADHVGRVGLTLFRAEGSWLIDHARLIEGASMLWDTDPVVEYTPPQAATPPEALRNHVAGRVLLGILIRRDGTTEVVEVLRGLPHGCTEAAVDHARRWRWKPARRQERAVEATGTIWVSFGETKPR